MFQRSMKKFLRSISAIMAVIVMLSAIPLTASAADVEFTPLAMKIRANSDVSYNDVAPGGSIGLVIGLYDVFMASPGGLKKASLAIEFDNSQLDASQLGSTIEWQSPLNGDNYSKDFSVEDKGNGISRIILTVEGKTSVDFIPQANAPVVKFRLNAKESAQSGRTMLSLSEGHTIYDRKGAPVPSESVLGQDLNVNIIEQTVTSLNIRSTHPILFEVGSGADLGAALWDSKREPIPGYIFPGFEYPTNAEIIWRSNDQSIVTVAASGRVTGVSPGRTIVTAEYRGVIGEIEVTIIKPPVILSVAIEPQELVMEMGEVGKKLKLIAAMSDGSTLDMTSVAYIPTFIDNKIYSFDWEGNVTAKSEGTTSSWVSITGVVGPVYPKVTVTPKSAVLEAITATPATVSLIAGQNQALSVKASYSDESETTVTPSAVYGTSNSAVATVDASGVVQAVSAGSATITITF
ncbi:Ig-like domain-containing protein, partial [Paenibacillus sinopodophylli]|uniref:Ig-like domain-containing protein n=1 Tax=Paenibacillus sinopodophylli TaxID=1837342 RepID=UPI0014865403